MAKYGRMMTTFVRRRLSISIPLVFLLMALVGQAVAEESFYKGKVVRIVVGFSPGGGFDTNSRILARHMGKHIPGNPTVIVENKTGAGSMIAANHVYGAVEPDGLTIGNFAGGLIMNQVFGKPGIEFDARKFQYIGVPAKTHVVCALTKRSGITSLDKWLRAKEPVKVGGLSPGNTTDDVPKILKETIDLPVRVVTGYKGTAKIRLAAESGEVAGGCWNWGSVRATWQRGLESGEVIVVLQAADKSHPELTGVPLAIRYAKTEEARKLIRVGIHYQAQILRIYALSPGTPQERVETLRKAYLDTMNDPEFRAEMKKSRQPVDPVTGEELDQIVSGFFEMEPALVSKLKTILK